MLSVFIFILIIQTRVIPGNIFQLYRCALKGLLKINIFGGTYMSTDETSYPEPLP